MVHLNSEGILKQGWEIQALDFLPDDLLLRTRLRKKTGGGNEKETLPQISNHGLIFVCCCFLQRKVTFVFTLDHSGRK